MMTPGISAYIEPGEDEMTKIEQLTQGLLKTGNLKENDTYNTFGAQPGPGRTGGGYTWRQKFLLVVFSLGSLLAGSCLAMMIPFLPIEAQRRGVSQTVTSLVFSIFSLTQLLSYPVVGRLLPRVGVNRLYCLGMALTGTSNLVFGTLFRIEDPVGFIVACCTVRVFEAIGTATVITAALTIAANQFSQNTSTAVAVMETMNAIGLSLGAAIGAGLYSLGGFGLPFFTQGSLIYVIVILSWLYMPPVLAQQQQQQRPAGSRQVVALLGTVDSWVCCLSVFTVALAWTMVDSTIARYAHDALGTTPAQLGLYFLVATGGYAFSSVLWGWLADRLYNTYALMCGCLLMAGLGLWLMPPLPLFGMPLQPSWWLLGLGLTVKELFQGGAYVPVLNRLIAVVVERGLPNDITTQAFVSSVFGTVVSVGNVLGPLVGGALIDLRNYKFMMTCLVGWVLTVGVLCGLQALSLAHRRRRRLAADGI